MEEKNFELEIAPLTEEELDAVDGGAGADRPAGLTRDSSSTANSRSIE